MLAVDTNVLVRLFVHDEPRQTAKAEALFRENEILILKIVLLETEWVMRYSYGLDRTTIVAAFRGLAGLPSVHLEEEPAVEQAIDWFSRGMDFGDAIHLGGGSLGGKFATFDRKLASAAQRFGAEKVVLLS